jgi:hypothetical protein
MEPIQGMLIPEQGDSVSFEWNPNIVNEHAHIKWNQMHVAGRDTPIFQFGCGEATRYDFILELSENGRGDDFVAKQCKALIAMKHPTIKGAGVDRPPSVTFRLGDLVNMKCVIEDIKAIYEPPFFPDSLNPKFGKAHVKLAEYK